MNSRRCRLLLGLVVALASFGFRAEPALAQATSAPPPAPSAPPPGAPALPMTSDVAATPDAAAPPLTTPLPTAPAAPPSPADLARAKASFEAGAAAYAAGEYLAAIQALESAYALNPVPAIAFSLAQAERRQYFVSRERQHLTRSLELFRRYLEEVPSGGRRTDTLEALAQLEPIASKLETTDPVPKAPAAERGTRLIIFSDAPAARISVDGVLRSGSPAVVDVTPGPHQVEVEAAGFHSARREVIALLGELVPVPMSLATLPSRLSLSTPPDAEIYVDGVFASQGGENVALTLPNGSHRVSVAQTGHRVVTRVVELERGETQAHAFSLEPTSQRRASNALFIGGAAAAGAGIAFSYLAVRSQQSAQEFLDRWETENVSIAEKVRYDADVTQRNRYRWIAGAGFASSLGMLITGLFLHELDEPGADDLYGPSTKSASTAEASRAPDRFDFSALIGPNQVGAALSGEF